MVGRLKKKGKDNHSIKEYLFIENILVYNVFVFIYIYIYIYINEGYLKRTISFFKLYILT